MALMRRIVNDLGRFDWADLQDPDSLGNWPPTIKGLVMLGLFATCLGAGYFLHLGKVGAGLGAAVADEHALRVEFQQKAYQAANLQQHREQTLALEAAFRQLLERLPMATETPELVDDITATGEGHGLEFTSITLQPEIEREFYIELPISIEVVGRYHDLAGFVSAVADLERIVSLHDFTIARRADAVLDVNLLAHTYRYRDHPEAAP